MIWERLEQIHSARIVPVLQKAGTPPAGFGLLWINRATGETSITKSSGTTTSLEGGGGGGAPTTADYLVKTADAGLSAERVVTDTTSITTDWATAGQAKIQRAALSGDVTAAANSNTVTVNQARGLRETAGPTTLTLGAVADGQILKRSGSTIIGVFVAFALVTSSEVMDLNGDHVQITGLATSTGAPA